MNIGKSKNTLNNQRHNMTTIQAQLHAMERENQILLDQLHEAQADLEKILLKERANIQEYERHRTAVNELENALVELKCEKKQLTETIDRHTKAASAQTALIKSLTSEVERLTADNKHYASKIQETEKDNDLLVTHLHHAQEELERNLIAHQATKLQSAELDRHLRKMQASYPDHLDYESLEVTLVQESGDTHLTQWRLSEVVFQNRKIAELRFKVQIENNMASLTFQRDGDNNCLTRWPLEHCFDQEFSLTSVAGGTRQGTNATLNALSTSDWKMVRALTKNLISRIDSRNVPKTLSNLDSQQLHKGLNFLLKTIDQWPLTLRYDDVSLISNIQHPNYDSLTIRLSNLQLGTLSWKYITYRLASVDFSKDSFGQNPRLEFPEDACTSLEGWFPESNDERGARLELRFAYPNAIDMNVWDALPSNDHLLITGLIATLPSQLSILQQDNIAKGRTWHEWQTLGSSLKEILLNSSIRSRYSNRSAF